MQESGLSTDANLSRGTDIPEIAPSELEARLGAGESFVIVDVRQPGEREIADLPDYGQLRIPMMEIGARIDELDPSKATVVYCRSGSRSGAVLQFLRAKGFASVINLQGGVLGWREQVDPTLREY